MRFKIENLRKQILQLHKLLKRFPRQPMPEDVHRLRRQIRTLETIVDALTSGRERKVHRLLKALILISKAAGKVRDMDVLMGPACSLPTSRKDECLVQLLDYLREQRFKAAAKLHAIISAKREEALHSLKQSSRLHSFEEERVNELTHEYSSRRASSCPRAEQLPSAE
jgi:CHAD domain-containing protein